MNNSLEEEKEQVLTLLTELHEAAGRSIYEEIQYFTAAQNSIAEIKLGAKRLKTFSRQNTQCRTWSMIIKDICGIVPIMTENEYLLASHLVSNCLLSYILPHKTKSVKIGPNHASRRQAVNMLADDLISLEDILESASYYDGFLVNSSHPYLIRDELIEASMWDFIYRGVGAFLSCRKLSLLETTMSIDNSKCTVRSGSSDLLHVLSMSICDDYSLNKNDNDLSSSDRVLHLMSTSHRRSFQISELLRGEMVYVISRTLSLPSIDITEKSATESLIAGGVLHLRTALQNFCMMTLNPHHLIDARRALASIAVDSDFFIQVAMKSLISDMMNDQSNQSSPPNCRSNSNDTVKGRLNWNLNDRYMHCHTNDCLGTFVLQSQIKRETTKKDFCLRCSTGDLVLQLIARYSGSRFHADDSFTQQMFVEIAASTNEIYDQLTRCNSHQVKKTIMPRPCSIAALLDCARLLFYFSVNQNVSDPTLTLTESQILETSSKSSILTCAVEFLKVSEYCVTKSASSLLALAFAYKEFCSQDDFARKIFIYLKNIFHRMDDYEIYYDLIGVLSRSNYQFACSIIQYSFDAIHSSMSSSPYLLKVVNIVSSARPTALRQYLEMNSVSIDLLPKASVQDLCYMYLSLKMSLSFDQNTNEWSDKIFECLCLVTDLWTLFKVARQAFCTGNFNVAEDIVEKRLLCFTSTSSSYSWLSILSSVARAEHFLQWKGSNGIVQALGHFNIALIQLRSLESTANTSTSFQIGIICCRRDVLNLCLVALNLAGEARLSSKTIRTNRRTCVHTHNLSRCFRVLASRYYDIFKRNGLFCCEATRSYLRSQFRLCTFLANSVQRAFASKKDAKTSINEDLNRGWPKGDKSSSLMELTSTLKKEVLDYWDTHQLNSEARAVGMSDIIDSIMKSVNPFPKAFLSFKNVPVTNTRVTMKQGISMPNEERVIPCEQMVFEMDASIPFSFIFSGAIPPKLFQLSDQPFSQIMISCNFSFDGPLQREDAEEERGLDKVFPTHLLDVVTAETSLLPNAKFTIECACPYISREGYYRCDVKLQVRDIRCGVYQIPSSFDDESILIVCKTSPT